MLKMPRSKSVVPRRQYADIGSAQQGVIRRVDIDIDTGGQPVTPELILDTGIVTLPSFSTSSRMVKEIPREANGRLIGIRLTGVILTPIELFGIETDTTSGIPIITPLGQQGADQELL